MPSALLQRLGLSALAAVICIAGSLRRRGRRAPASLGLRRWYDPKWPRDRLGRWDDPKMPVPRPTYERYRESYYSGAGLHARRVPRRWLAALSLVPRALSDVPRPRQQLAALPRPARASFAVFLRLCLLPVNGYGIHTFDLAWAIAYPPSM